MLKLVFAIKLCLRTRRTEGQLLQGLLLMWQGVWFVQFIEKAFYG